MIRSPLTRSAHARQLRRQSINYFSTQKDANQAFFQRVNKQMGRDSPYKYEQYEKGRNQAMKRIQKRLNVERAKNSGRWWVRSADLQKSTSDSNQSSDSPRMNEFLSNSPSSQTNTRFTFESNTLLTNDTPKTSIFSTLNASIQASYNTPISELFAPPAPPPKPRDKALLYNTDHYETYQEVMNVVLDAKMDNFMKKQMKDKGIKKEIIESVKKWLLGDERFIEKQVVENTWKKLDNVWRSGWEDGAATIFDANDPGTTVHDSNVMTELKTQQDLFMAKLLSNNPDLLETFTIDGTDEEEAKLMITKQFHAISIQLITFLLRHCAKRSRSDPMHVCWYKVKESGLELPQDSISTFLYVVTTMGSSLGSMFNRSHGEEEENIYLVPEEVATYHDLLCKPTESSVSLRIKTLAGQGDTVTAEELLEAFKKSIEGTKAEEPIRLRTYIPILKNYCEEGNVAKALSVFHKMKNTQGVVLDPETFCMLIAALAENGCFANDASPVDSANELGYNNSHGPQLFDEIAKDMAENVLEISSASARKLSNALAAGFKDALDPDSEGENSDNIVSSVKEAHPLAPIPVSKNRAMANELVACRVLLNRLTGTCEVTGAQQQLILLESSQRKQFLVDLIELSKTQYTNYTKNIGSRDKHAANDSEDKAAEQLQKFSDWLNTREGAPFTAIVDGANVGYYMQNFAKGGFNYHQIKFMVDTLESRGETPLVVLPNKYNNTNYIYNSKQQVQRLDEKDVDIMTDLRSRGMLYTVPPRCLDDLYWMVASVSDQTASRNNKDLSVPSNDSSGRFPGTRPMLITNDQMRDHRLELLEPRLFRRWYGCHIVNYTFTAFMMDENVAGNEVRFAQADFFSREIQGNECPDTAKGTWVSKAWHFPVSDWDLDERFVIRIPNHK